MWERLFTNRKDTLIVSSCRTFRYLKISLNISGKALMPAIDTIVDHENCTVTSPTNGCLSYLFINLFDFLWLLSMECHISIVNIGLAYNVEFGIEL